MGKTQADTGTIHPIHDVHGHNDLIFDVLTAGEYREHIEAQNSLLPSIWRHARLDRQLDRKREDPVLRIRLSLPALEIYLEL